jgi:hypothetical protein
MDGVEEWRQAFLKSVLDAGDWSTSGSGCFTTEEWAPVDS